MADVGTGFTQFTLLAVCGRDIVDVVAVARPFVGMIQVGPVRQTLVT